MTLRLVRWGTARAMPWKNGGGVTHEIAIHPDGAGTDEFDWRISIAEVATDGPFSCFAGIDRTLCLLDGAGIVLHFAGGPKSLIDGAANPVVFPGEADVTGRLRDGKILDLNVMTRRGVATHRVLRIAIEGRMAIAGETTTVVVCRDGRLQVSGTELVLTAKDCLLMRSEEVTLDGRGTVFLVTIASVV